MSDEKLRGDVMRAFGTANDLYRELMSDRDEPVRIAARVATDDDVRDKLRDAIEDLRSASDRLQGEARPLGRNTALLFVGHRARSPLQPGHRARDPPLHQGPADRRRSGSDFGRDERERQHLAVSLTAAGARPAGPRLRRLDRPLQRGGIEAVRGRDVRDLEQDGARLRRGVPPGLARRPARRHRVRQPF